MHVVFIYRPFNAKTHSSEKVFLRKKQGQRHTYPALSHKTLFFCRNLHPPETVSRVAFCFIPLFFKLRHTVDWEMSSSPDIRWVEVVGSWRSSSRTAVVLSSPDAYSGRPLHCLTISRFQQLLPILHCCSRRFRLVETLIKLAAAEFDGFVLKWYNPCRDSNFFFRRVFHHP